MKRIIIIGYMGSGKTTVGHALSQELGLPFYDLDWYIETRMHRTVKQIFDEKGEEGFRKIEHNLLHEVAEFEDVIISCGGGTPCFFDNIDYINRQGETVEEVLEYVQYNPKKLVRQLEQWVTKGVKEGKLSLDEGKEFLATYRSGLYGYTYLE